VYAPVIVDVTLTDKNGSFEFQNVPRGTSVTLKIRATQLNKSGMDIPTTSGNLYEITTAATRNYNPRSCRETDHLQSLYQAALRVRDNYRLALADQQKLRVESKKPNKQASERAIHRTQYHARRYLDLSALLPDRELLCKKSDSSCTKLDLRSVSRMMRISARHIRLESLLFNRRLRFEGLRTEKESDTRIRRIRKNDSRAISLIKKLARGTFECT
jgi:hypothetical protein